MTRKQMSLLHSLHYQGERFPPGSKPKMLETCIHKPWLLQGLDILLCTDTIYGSNHNEILILIPFGFHPNWYLPDASMDFLDS